MNELSEKVEKLFLSGDASIGEIFKILIEEGYSKEEINTCLQIAHKKYIHTTNELE